MEIVNAVIKKDNQILVVKRKKEPWPGMYGLPGGHVELNESKINALVRELKEEIGLIVKINELNYLGKFEVEDFEISLYNANAVLKEWRVQDEEVEEVKWLNLQDFYDNLREHNIPQEGIGFLKGLLSKHF